MKDIEEYIKLNKPKDIYQPSLKYSNEHFYEEIKEFYGEKHIPNDLVLLYENNLLIKFKYEYINENLKSHDVEKLKAKLLEYYPDDIKEFKDYKGDNLKSFYIITKNNTNNKKLNIMDLHHRNDETENFFNLLNFFNYTYREWKKIDNDICLFIEPIYSEDASDYFDKCHRQAYHFTYKENVKNILKNGIKLRERNSQIRYPKRIYLWATDNKKEINDNNSDLLNFVHKIFENDKLSLKDIGIIKVDLYHTNFPVYKDTAMKEKEALFVYNIIPVILCKEIKIK